MLNHLIAVYLGKYRTPNIPTMSTMDPRYRIAYDAAFYTLAMVFLLFRFAHRLTPTSIRKIRQNLSIPALLADFFMLLSLAFTTTAIGLDIWLQRRTIYLSSDWKYVLELISLYRVGMKFMFADQMFWALLMWSVKAALMALYYDIATHVTPRVKQIMHITCVVLLLTLLAVIAVFLGWCRPLDRNWTLGDNMCSPQTYVFPVAFTSALHMITDIMVLGIPLLILRTLHLQRAQAIAVYFILGIGFLAFSVSLVSLVLQIEVVGINHDSPSYLSEMEIKTERVYLAAIAECSIAIVGACLPSLRVILRVFFKYRDRSGNRGSDRVQVRKEKDLVGFGGNGGASGSSAADSLVMRPRPGDGLSFPRYGSDFGPSRPASPAPRLMVDFNEPPLSIRESLKGPILAMVRPAFSRSGSHSSLPNQPVATGGKGGKVVPNSAIRQSPSVDSLTIGSIEAPTHGLRPLI